MLSYAPSTTETEAGAVSRLPLTPRVRIRHTESGRTVEPAIDQTGSLEGFHAAFLAAFGTVDELVAEALFTQVLNGLHTDPAKAVDNATANLALALMHEIGPKDVVEAMLAGQMIIAHLAVMDASRRALHVEQSAGDRAVYLNLARRLMMTFGLQMDSLGRHRGKPTVQKVIVEEVLIAPGAQAVVGAVANGGRGDGG